MWHDLKLLLRLRVRTAWNAVRTAAPARLWIGAILGTGSIFLFAGILFAFAAFLAGIRDSQGTAAVAAIIDRTVYFLFLFLLAGAIPFVSGVLLSPGDLAMLAASPVRPASVVAARLLDAVIVSSGQFVVIGVPLLVAAAWVSFGGFCAGWLVFLPLLALFLALPPLIVSSLLLILARIAGLRRVRAVVALASVILSVALCLLSVSELTKRASTGNRNVAATIAAAEIADSSRSGRIPSPSNWASETIIALGSHRPSSSLLPLILFAGMTVVAGVLASWLGGPVLIGESLLEGEGISARHASRRSRLEIALALVPFLGIETRALIAKDLRYIARDLVLLSQIGIPFILYFVPFVIGGAQGAGRDNDLLMWLSLGIVGTIVYMLTSILSLSSVGLEGQAFWLVLAAPMSSATFVRAKWLAATGASIALSAPLLLIDFVVYQIPIALAAYAFLALCIAAASLCGLGVGLSGVFPRFVYENPAHRASLAALVGGFIGATLYVLIAGGALGIAFYLAPQWPERASVVYVSGIGIFLLVSLLLTVFSLGFATARLDGYGWEE